VETICSILCNPFATAIQEVLEEGDVRFNKELLLIARHMVGTYDLVFSTLYDSFTHAGDEEDDISGYECDSPANFNEEDSDFR